MLISVYGTLKKGHGNNGRLRNATFVTSGIVRGFKLYDSGFPVAAPSDNDCIKVEVWDIGNPEESTVAKSTLSGLDSLEGYYEDAPDHSMYLRKPVKVFCDSGESIDGEMYIGNSRTWRDFKTMREMPQDDSGIYYWPR